MRRRKSKPGDEILIYDESLDVVARSCAIFRLAVDGYIEMKPLLVSLLNHKEFMLRGEAIGILIGGWKIPEYLGEAIRMLHTDVDIYVRSDAASALSNFAQRSEEGIKQRDVVIQELLYGLMKDEDVWVQSRCYECLLNIIAPERGYIELPDDFDRERDVDWDLLKPYLKVSPR